VGTGRMSMDTIMLRSSPHSSMMKSSLMKLA